jgi:hypothetical protein
MLYSSKVHLLTITIKIILLVINLVYPTLAGFTYKLQL